MELKPAEKTTESHASKAVEATFRKGGYTPRLEAAVPRDTSLDNHAVDTPRMCLSPGVNFFWRHTVFQLLTQKLSRACKIEKKRVFNGKISKLHYETFHPTFQITQTHIQPKETTAEKSTIKNFNRD